jgi:hypothetical protein
MAGREEEQEKLVGKMSKFFIRFGRPISGSAGREQKEKK